MKIQAVIFDCDGLMFNTEQMSKKMWRQEAEKMHISIPDEFFTAITGARNDSEARQQFAYIPHLNELCTLMKTKRFDHVYWSSFKTDELNKKGLLQLYSYLEEKGIRRAVGSSSSRQYVEALIANVSVPMHFDALITGDQVVHGKPDPEIFLKAAKALDTAKENCLVLEDSKQGILAARSAGMHSCFIQDTIIPDKEMKEAIEFQKNDLAQVIDLL
ncbi:MAG: HAD family phosphatase [Solobacterium sp.]|jgi:beta-phosphoglucomutase-like phosphatase (HAD superfamily)|nr:HAD family phosphatase [Solobacterium sp.]MCH4205514.1 HAD family phosphatase [Solobacterium sp.]MCH4227038.1 HAD family phosphatase [Solobacterium sp.]MCH4282201.1 HAD family phosphatase [Solobacterium sp.]